MEDVTSDWNLERLANEESKLKAQEEGSFNAMDGRYHKSQTSRDVLKRQHIEQTSETQAMQVPSTWMVKKRIWLLNETLWTWQP